MQLVLYTGPGCDLCDVAYSMVMQAPLNCQIVRRNVRDDLALYHRYGAKIPVLERVDSQAQLSWPFSQNELESFLQ